MAERVGFEPTVGGYPTHDFQSCTFDHSVISPQSLLHKMAERVGFEPTVTVQPHWFSRPARSTTPAPLPILFVRPQGSEKTLEQIGTFPIAHPAAHLTTVIEAGIGNDIAQRAAGAGLGI